MHAKSLQSYPTLCNPMDFSPPGFYVCEHSPSKNTGVGCLALLQGIFLTQQSNFCLLYLLHLQANSLPQVRPGKPLTSEPMCILSQPLEAVGFMEELPPGCQWG